MTLNHTTLSGIVMKNKVRDFWKPENAAERGYLLMPFEEKEYIKDKVPT
jgi:hypothetical protein